nr:MAG TPA: hypothetical protein [Caudoviricetes sp.]
MSTELNLNSPIINIERRLGRVKVSFYFDTDYIELPTAVWNYGAIVSALIRHKYSESEVEAIVSNSLMLMQNPSSVSEEESNEKLNEFNEFQEYREKCKARAKELLAIGKEMGIKEM